MESFDRRTLQRRPPPTCFAIVADPAGVLRVAAELCGLPIPEGPTPSIGDDRGCAEPYREFMAAELG